MSDGKEAEVRLPYKNDGSADKLNCRPISILSNVSNIYMKDVFKFNYTIILIKEFFQYMNMAFVKASVLSTHA